MTTYDVYNNFVIFFDIFYVYICIKKTVQGFNFNWNVCIFGTYYEYYDKLPIRVCDGVEKLLEIKPVTFLLLNA